MTTASKALEKSWYRRNDRQSKLNGGGGSSGG